MKNNKAVNAGIWYTISNFITKGVNFLTIPIFTRMLTQEEFGEYSNFTSWLQIITIFATLSLHASLVRARFDYKEEFNSYIKSILYLGSFSSFLLLIITRMNNGFWVNTLSMPDYFIIYMLLYTAVSPAIEIFQTVQRFLYRYKLSVFLSFFMIVSTTLSSLVLMNIMNNKLNGRLLGAYVPLILLGSVIYCFYIKKGKLRIGYWRYALKICLPYIPHLLAMTVLNSTDRIMINHYCGAQETALYSVAYTCSLVVSVLWSSINGAFSPWLGEKLYNREYYDIRKISIVYVLVVALPLVFIAIISPELLYIIGGKKYVVAKHLMTPIMLGCFFQFLYTMYVNIEQYEKKTYGMAIASVIAAICNVGLNYLFIPIFGYVAAAYTTVVGYLVLLIIHYYLVNRMRLSNVYNTKGILVIIVIVTLLMFIIDYLYNYFILRIIFGLLALIISSFIILKNKRIIVSFVHKK